MLEHAMVDRRVDLRSDTLTQPSPAMRDAMAHATLGDDLFGESPTVNALQEYAASSCGQDAALWGASGTMANQTSLLVSSPPRYSVF